MEESSFGAVPPLAPDLWFAALLLLFAGSVLIVCAWLLQLTRGPLVQPPGARSLLVTFCSFPSVRESWAKAWAQALNREAVRNQSSVQMQFEENILLQPNVHISHVACTEHSDNNMVLLCRLSANTVKFPISVTQESPAVVSCDTYQVSLTIQEAQVEVKLQELPQEGLLVSWGFKEPPDILLQIDPKQSHQREAGAELCTIQELIHNALLTAEPAMMFSLKAHGGDVVSYDNLLPVSADRTDRFKLHVRQLQLQNVILPCSDVELMCAAELDHPHQRKNTRGVRVLKTMGSCSATWSEEMTFDLTYQSKELSFKVWQIFRNSDDVLLGHTLVTLQSPHKELCGVHLYPLISSLLSTSTAPAISVEFHIPEMSLVHTALGTPSQRINITPTKKVEMDRTVMPDGTIITTVTTIQSRPKLDGRMDSPARSPSKVEVTENKPVILPQSDSSGFSPSSSGGSPVSIKLDPVAETAIRQLTEPGNKSTKRTPTKRSTLIISGVSKAPVGEDEMALSLGYAASMDATLQGTSTSFQHSDAPYLLREVTSSGSQEVDDTTRSEISDRPSVDDLDSDTGSTGALETQSLKDHKVGFLRSGTKLLFRWHHRHAGLSQSHDDLTNCSTFTRKKGVHFPRRLLKRFSLKTKPSVNGSSQARDK